MVGILPLGAPKALGSPPGAGGASDVKPRRAVPQAARRAVRAGGRRVEPGRAEPRAAP